MFGDFLYQTLKYLSSPKLYITNHYLGPITANKEARKEREVLVSPRSPRTVSAQDGATRREIFQFLSLRSPVQCCMMSVCLPLQAQLREESDL